jgi:hypothetical protein
MILVLVGTFFAIAAKGFGILSHPRIHSLRGYTMSMQSESRADDRSPDVTMPDGTVTEELTFISSKRVSVSKRRWFSRRKHEEPNMTQSYSYKYDKLRLDPIITQASTETIGLVLIHPIGVGISRWFYERLLLAFSSLPTRSKRYIIISPDLLGSGSGCDPIISFSDGPSTAKYPHMLNISDWTDQLLDLMARNEKVDNVTVIDRWCVIANGGCSPIALQVAARSLDSLSCPLQRPVSNVIISSAPRLSFFLNSTDATKVLKSYDRLCGVLGRLFWWYACRKEGKFIQTFSEKNLVADPANLGDTWRGNCYTTAIARSGTSRYSTFAFLAGCLQDGCKTSLTALKGQMSVQIDVIKGRDVRRNPARSWFWQKSKRRKEKVTTRDGTEQPQMYFRDYLQENGNGGREVQIGGRVSLAHEDATGYAESVVYFLEGTVPS